MSVSRAEQRRDLAYLADGLNVDVRTVRRWCEKGIVPGAYRAKKGSGHWRVRNPVKASLALTDSPPAWHRQRKSLKREQARQTYPSIEELREASNPNSPANLAKRLYFAHIHRVTYEEFTADKLRTHTQEVRYDLCQISISELNKKIPQVLWQLATNRALALLYLAGSKLRFFQRPLTRQTLADELGISRASLYRKYRRAQIEEVLNDSGRTQNNPSDTSAHTTGVRGGGSPPYFTLTGNSDTSAHAERVREAERNVYRPFRHVG